VGVLDEDNDKWSDMRLDGRRAWKKKINWCLVTPTTLYERNALLMALFGSASFYWH
jgi:hypothetical protein